MKEEVQRFFDNVWGTVVSKHDQGVYNTVCLVVLLALPLVVLLTCLIVCCHCCCCRRRGGGCCGRGEPTVTASAKSTKKKKKDKSPQNEDLWISVKPGPMTPERMALTVV